MDRRGGCCIARYTNGGVYDMSKVDRIMLRFRPIAPKPAAGDGISGGSPAESSERVSSKTVRGKRRYNKENNKNSNKKNKNKETELTRKTSSDSVVTLSLLPETPERREREKVSEVGFWALDGGHVANQQTAEIEPVTSVVTVECVSDTWQDINTLGKNDEEKMVSLMNDTCPGFVTDGGDRVKWSNRAYGEMVGSKREEEAVVWLVMREKVAVAACDAFSCRVTVRWTSPTCRKEKTLPCDVWRMDGGGFAWRLDVEAALSLGR